MLKTLFPRFIRFSLLGSAILFFTVILTYFLTEFLGLYYLYSYIIVLTSSTTINFSLASRVVFKTRDRHLRRFLFYLISYGVFYVLDILFTKILTDSFNFYYILSIFLSKAGLFLLKFIFYDRLLFNDASFIFMRKK